MYQLDEIEEAIKNNIGHVVEAIKKAEKAQPYDAYMQIDWASVVEAFTDAIVGESDFHQSIEDDEARSDDAAWTARRQLDSSLTLWRIKEYGKTCRELRREEKEIAMKAKAAREASQ